MHQKGAAARFWPGCPLHKSRCQAANARAGIQQRNLTSKVDEEGSHEACNRGRRHKLSERLPLRGRERTVSESTTLVGLFDKSGLWLKVPVQNISFNWPELPGARLPPF